ncbi:MAG: hypothetical protein GWM98_11150 [Nitrospinaceae bacterium]|nr:hypothetical protein [Nitrospinaceae bacterium]NIR54951.1 hypothetical protein [Nitrospinaceae bacterium]NIT82193.1 hypothetical protein [Nitrospinaceae bacterium]NIW06031.1 hypothetical protein [Nitrospinaceae bacterium]NIX34580.1 hypothetical protein [Nitrospinaceae bacterium]
MVKNQIDAMQEADLSRKVRLGPMTLTQGKLREDLIAFFNLLKENLPRHEFRRRLREEFAFYRAGVGKKRRVLFTGYYTPLIPASRVRTEEYRYPLYRMPEKSRNLRYVGHPPKPADAVQDTGRVWTWRDYTREHIDRLGALSNRGLEIAWLKDDLERFFLHIQGSGRLRFRDGTVRGVRYLGANNYPYTGIGKRMVKDKVIAAEEGSMQGIKRYLRAHPEEVPKYLFQNKRYIFFALTDEPPRGSGGGDLVAGRSIATDKSIFPAGGLAYIILRKPVLNDDHEITGWKRVARFVVDQDTGNAIRGPGRADLYFGAGHRAGVKAGHFQEWGQLFYLIKK